MQEVKIYYDILDAYSDIRKYIEWGWRVHTCTMGCYKAGYEAHEKILVIYEKS